jgi:uncharacterized protein
MATSNRTVLTARTGTAIPLAIRERLRVINTTGGQVVDTWALSAADPSEHMSMQHTRAILTKLVPAAGDSLYSNRRRALLEIAEDTSPGVHDTLIAACDPERYEQLGAPPGHASCADNFQNAIAAHGITYQAVPSPLNLFMNIPWSAEGALEFAPSPARRGDYVTLAALADVLVVLSACPQDIVVINSQGPADVALEKLSVSG